MTEMSPLQYAESRYPVVPVPPTGPEFPAGHGGVAVHTSVRREDRRAFDPPMIGIDGEPAFHGWGTAVVVVPAGEHVVEVQSETPVRSVRVTVEPGGIVPIRYSPLRGLGEPSPQTARRRPLRTGGMPIVILYAVAGALVPGLAVLVLTVQLGGSGRLAGGVAAMVMLAVAIGQPVRVALARRRDRAEPMAAPPVARSDTASAEASPSAGSGPVFVGDDPDAAVLTPPPGWGSVLVSYWFTSGTGGLDHGRVQPERPNVDRWISRPGVVLDGDPVPAGWSGWWYPLPPGRHMLEVRTPAPASLVVDVSGGAQTRLVYRAELSVLSTDDRAAATEPARPATEVAATLTEVSAGARRIVR
jgi:hypothetical protein